MLYFSGFQLDLKRKVLTYQGQRVELTRKTFDLLAHLVQHPQQVHTKDDLITHVWNGRVVSGNTIDQTSSKLRKILTDLCQQPMIESIYGQGIQWTAPISNKPPKSRSFKPPLTALILITLVALFAAWYVLFKQPTDKPPTNTGVVLLQLAANDVDWEVQSASNYLQQLVSFASQSSVKSVADRPQFVLSEDFIQNQQKLNPNLTIIKIKPLAGEQQMTWLIEVTQAQQLLIQTTVSADNYQALMSKSIDVLLNQLELSTPDLHGLLPADAYIMSLYVRGLHSLESNQLDKAKQQLLLATQEQPSFHLARLKLAETLNQLGQIDETITTLDTLLALDIPAAIKVAASTLKVRTLKVQGDYQAAADTYQQLFNTPINAPPDIWLKARIEYAAVLNYMNQTQQALGIYNAIIDAHSDTESTAVLADVRVAKASLLQKQGDVAGAQHESEQALRLYELNKDLVGMARTYSVLARIANQKAQYKLAEQYLRQALNVTESVGHKLGEGAVLNELIYALMVQGKHQEAWLLNNRLLAIGTELDYSGMQMAAYQAFYEMSRIQQNWDSAARWWQSYQQLAEQIQDERRLVKAQLFQVNLLLDQGITNGVAEKMARVQSHIDTTDEHLMQPGLDVFLGRYQWLIGQQNTAIETLLKAKKLAVEMADYETIITANNYLAMFYLAQQDPQKALNTLQQSTPHQPFAIPYLRLKAEALLMQNKNIDALNTLNTCQQQAAELWGPQEQALLQKIKQRLEHNPEQQLTAPVNPE